LVSAVRRRVVVRGVVQGVGFRPFVLRLAAGLGLAGFVGNDGSGVFVEVQGGPDEVARFVTRLVDEAPALAVVEHVEVTDAVPETGATGAFTIVASRPGAGPATFVPPDVATCDACLAEVDDPADQRFRYPFANCTDCGPRFTVIEGLPYDRAATSMSGFALCPDCAAEYADPADRRFHAEPIACPVCGPQLALHRGDHTGHGTDAVLAGVHLALADGEVVAVKGIGGYHLACDATADGPLSRLRERKGRGEKPFALMVPDLDAARRMPIPAPAADQQHGRNAQHQESGNA